MKRERFAQMAIYDSNLLDRILEMDMNDLHEFVDGEIDSKGLFHVSLRLLESRRKCDYYEFIVKYLHPEFKAVLLGNDKMPIMIGMFSDDMQPV